MWYGPSLQQLRFACGSALPSLSRRRGIGRSEHGHSRALRLLFSNQPRPDLEPACNSSAPTPNNVAILPTAFREK
jgi:hypothetical protein